MTKVKICCIQSIAEALIAIDKGAYAIGLVSKMPSGPGVISDKTIREIANWAPNDVKTVLLTSLLKANELVKQIDYCNPNIVQLVDYQDAEIYETLHMTFPGLEIMQVIHIVDEDSALLAKDVSYYVDYLLLDSGNPNLETKELGGTGKTHNWEISEMIVDSIEVPVFLAGGLNPDNVSEAITKVKPFGVDLCSGLRLDGRLDETKVKKFMENVNIEK